MKPLAALTLAVALAAATVSTANAFGIYPTEPTTFDTEETLHVGPDGTVHDHCHGMTSGQAHKLCGSASGGPVGGLF